MSDEFSFKSIAKQFEYEKICREIDYCSDVDDLRKMLKSYVQLHLRTQETIMDDLMLGLDKGGKP